jgi:hypothetical protein
MNLFDAAPFGLSLLVVLATVLNGRVEQVGNREGKGFMKEADG